MLTLFNRRPPTTTGAAQAVIDIYNVTKTYQMGTILGL